MDEVAICLLTVFEQRGLTFELFEALIKQEVEDTGSDLSHFLLPAITTGRADVLQKTSQSFSDAHASQPRCFQRMPNGRERSI